MNKTPIMILQEYSVKKGFLPIYEEIASISGTHNNKFVIRVTCQSTTADGVASTKKQAKQNAAKEMLFLLTESGVFPNTVKLMLQTLEPSDTSIKQKELEASCAQLHSSVMDSPVSSLSPSSAPNSPASGVQSGNSFVNYVGKLNEFCCINRLPDPQFEVINVSGVSHLPAFTMICTIATIQEEATASTKKTAKHEVAKKMLKRIMLMLNSGVAIQACDTISNDATIEGTLTTLRKEFETLQIIDNPKWLDHAEKERILQIYKETTHNHVSVQHSVPVCQYHTILSELIRQSSFETGALGNLELVNTQSLKSIVSVAFQKPLNEINFSVKSNDIVIGFRVDIKPTVLQIGVGKTMEEARMKALLKLCDLIAVFLK